MTEINKSFTRIESAFNIAGSLPLVGIFSGIARIVVAKIQFIAGCFMGIFGLFGRLINGSQDWKDLTHAGFAHVMHGILNILRGFGEMVLSASLIGCIPLLIAQAASKNKFGPVFKYSEENAATI